VLSTVTDMTDHDDQAPIDPRGYERAYEVVAARLEHRIRAGEWAYHMPLPSEPALSEWYGVSRTTVRSAIRLLAAKEMVEVRTGKGTYVTWQPEGDAG
jgi:GntR family transcriptional regulator